MSATRRTNDGFERMNNYPSDSETDNDDPNHKPKRLVSSTDNICPDRIRKCKRCDLICILIGTGIVGVAVLVIILSLVLQGRGSGAESSTVGVRLPSSIQPGIYTIHLTVDFKSYTVTGSESISINVLSPTEKIYIHSKNISITDSSISINGDLGSIRNTYTVEEHDFYVMEVGSLSVGDDVSLSLEFTYKLRPTLSGFYLSTYQSANGESKDLATTQFEPTDARRAFPCFDEPAMKANFSITITHPQSYIATSNMPVESTANSKRELTTTTRFQTSYHMSTYLVAFVVSDFQCSDPSIVNNHIKVRICSSPVVFNSTSYAQQVTNDVIGYYEEFFGVRYPLPKQDLLAIPDFAAGAMENWGLITYRETALLYDPSKNPLTSKQRVAVVVAHELAHQWFGNLVTMEWWDGLWLNEGFASYVEYIGADHKEKSWKMLEQFYVQTIQYAYAADSLNYSHPILQDVNDPDEINSLFDSISYDKGASLIRMLLNHVGESDFTKGLANYLEDHKFGNADTSQLWEAMNEVSPSDPSVSSIMDTWTKQMGFPVVTVTRSGDQVKYKQERFLLNPLPTGGQMAPSPYNYQWIIPFTYTTSTSPDNEDRVLIQDTQGTIQVTLSSGEFLKGNVHQNGFYRVNYDDENWKLITDHLMSSSFKTVLSGVDRAGLMDDAFALANGGYLNITKALDLSLYLRNEREYVPWRAASVWLDILSGTLALTPVYGKYQRYVNYLINDTVSQFPLEGSNLSHLDTFLKTLVLHHAWQNGNTAVANQLKQKFTNWMKTSTQTDIEPDLKYIVYTAGIALGGEQEWDFMWNRYLTVSDPYEKQLILGALSYSTEPWILNRYLQYALEGKIRTQDVDYVIRGVSVNIHGRQLAWNFFRDNYDFIFERFGGSSFSFSRLIRVLTKSFSTHWELYEIQSFFKDQNTGSATLAVQQAMETVSGNILWMNNNLDTLNKWIDENIP